MTGGFDKGRLDWLAEIGGALALALGVGFAALKLGPGAGWPLPAGLGALAVGWAAMRAVPAEPRLLAIAEFALAEPQAEALLLDRPVEASAELAELLLEDALPAPSPDSRVVQLFALANAGVLKARIDRHLAAAGRSHGHRVRPAPDASDALAEALAELRRSLRQA